MSRSGIASLLRPPVLLVIALLFIAVDIALVVSSRTAEPGLYTLAPTPAAIVLRPTTGADATTPLVFLGGKAIPYHIMKINPSDPLHEFDPHGPEFAFLPVDDHSMRVVAEVIHRATDRDSAKYDAPAVPPAVPATWIVSYIPKATMEGAHVTREIHVSTARLRASAEQWKAGLHSDLDIPLRQTLSVLVAIGEGNPHSPAP
jgi:hypothetical protein